MTYKDYDFWTKEKLWQLRQEIVLGSLFLSHYNNSFDIPVDDCCNFFDGFLDDCVSIESEIENCITALEDLYDKYDNADALCDYFYSVEHPFGM